MTTYRKARMSPRSGTRADALLRAVCRAPGRFSADYADIVGDTIYNISAMLTAMRRCGHLSCEQTQEPQHGWGRYRANHWFPLRQPDGADAIDALPIGEPVPELEREDLKKLYWSARNRRLSIAGKVSEAAKIGNHAQVMAIRVLQQRVRALEVASKEVNALRLHLQRQVRWIEEAFPKLKQQRLAAEAEDGRRVNG